MPSMLLRQIPQSRRFLTSMNTLVALGRSKVWNPHDHENRWYALWEYVLQQLVEGFPENDDPDAGILFCTTSQFAISWADNMHYPQPDKGLEGFAPNHQAWSHFEGDDNENHEDENGSDVDVYENDDNEDGDDVETDENDEDEDETCNDNDSDEDGFKTPTPPFSRSPNPSPSTNRRRNAYTPLSVIGTPEDDLKDIIGGASPPPSPSQFRQVPPKDIHGFRVPDHALLMMLGDLSPTTLSIIKDLKIPILVEVKRQDWNLKLRQFFLAERSAETQVQYLFTTYDQKFVIVIAAVGDKWKWAKVERNGPFVQRSQDERLDPDYNPDGIFDIFEYSDIRDVRTPESYDAFKDIFIALQDFHPAAGDALEPDNDPGHDEPQPIDPPGPPDSSEGEASDSDADEVPSPISSPAPRLLPRNARRAHGPPIPSDHF